MLIYIIVNVSKVQLENPWLVGVGGDGRRARLIIIIIFITACAH